MQQTTLKNMNSLLCSSITTTSRGAWSKCMLTELCQVWVDNKTRQWKRNWFYIDLVFKRNTNILSARNKITFYKTFEIQWIATKIRCFGMTFVYFWLFFPLKSQYTININNHKRKGLITYNIIISNPYGINFKQPK